MVTFLVSVISSALELLDLEKVFPRCILFLCVVKCIYHMIYSFKDVELQGFLNLLQFNFRYVRCREIK